MTAEPFVMNNRTYCLIDGVQFVIYTIAPDLLPFSQTVVRDTRSQLYGKIQLVYNVHSLIHLADDAKQHGALDHISSFPFESYLGRLKKPLHRPK